MKKKLLFLFPSFLFFGFLALFVFLKKLGKYTNYLSHHLETTIVNSRIFSSHLFVVAYV